MIMLTHSLEAIFIPGRHTGVEIFHGNPVLGNHLINLVKGMEDFPI